VKIVFVYLLSCCLILFGGYRYAHGGTHRTHSGYSAAKHIEKAQQVKFTHTGEDLTVVNSTLSTDDKLSIFSLEDDDDVVFSRKYVLLENYFVTLAYASLLVYFYNDFKNRLYNSKLIYAARPCTFLLQGALRI
jgi:hypothetical protein